MYPSQVYLKPHPCGEGIYFKGKPTMFFKRINVCHVRVSYDDVIIHSIIKLIGRDWGEDIELYLYDFEIETMKKCYINLEIHYIDGYSYKAKFLPWREEVNQNYKKRLVAKAEGDVYNTLRYKLLNNSGAYGKFVERPHNLININYINALGIIDSQIEEKDEIKVNAKYTYIPLSSIPAYGRCCLVENALKFLWSEETQSYSRRDIVYFDTDSIFVIWNEHTKYVWENEINRKNELGGWGMEDGGLLKRSQFTAAKRYKTENKDGKPDIKAGGINFDFYKEANNKQIFDEYMKMGMSKKEALAQIMIPFDEVNIISSDWKVQRAYRVKGGTLIEFQEKEVSIPKKYIDIYTSLM